MTPNPLSFDELMSKGPTPDALVAEAIDHFGLQVDKVEAVHESYSSTVRRLILMSGERMILKIPFIRLKLFRELHALQQLRDLPVSTVFDAWVREDDGPGALLLSVLPGDVVRGLVAEDLARQMGGLLARLHTHELDHFGEAFREPDDEEPGWWEMLDARFESWRPVCEPVMPEDLYRRALDRYAELTNDLPEPDGPCWTHFDYRPGNIMVDVPGEEETARITGLIDFESARGGSADIDFVKISHRVWDTMPGTREAFCEGYAEVRPVPDIEHTLPYYRLTNAFGGIAWCIRRSSTGDPFFRENMELLRHELEMEA